MMGGGHKRKMAMMIDWRWGLKRARHPTNYSLEPSVWYRVRVVTLAALAAQTPDRHMPSGEK